jgi:GAF domain-containing protein/HAMP domain-containing protein
MAVVSLIQFAQVTTWQTLVVSVLAALYCAGTLAAWRLAKRGKATWGAWLLIGGLDAVILLTTMLERGVGIALALVLWTVTLILARYILPGPHVARAFVISAALGVLTILIEVSSFTGRVDVQLVSALMPWVSGGIMVVLVVVIARQFPYMPLRAKLIVVSLLVALVPLLLLGLIYTLSTQERELASTNANLLTAAEETSAGLDEFIQSQLSEIGVAAQLPGLGDLLNTPPDSPDYASAQLQANQVLRALARRDPLFLSSYALLDKTGTTALDTYAPDIGINKSDRDYFLSVIANNLPYVSSVQIAPATNRPSLYFSAPVRGADGKVIGVLRARYDAALLQERLFASNGLGGSSSGAILLDENGVQLANGLKPDDDFRIVGNLPSDRIAVLRAERRLPDRPTEELIMVVPEFAAGLHNAAAVPVFSAEIHTDLAEGEYSGEQVAVANLKTRPWQVAFTRSRAEVLGPITQQTRNILLGGMLIVAVIIGVAALVSQVIARPVVSLTKAAEKIGQGDLTVRAVATSHDEIGKLALTFNSMTQQLSELITSLEARVQARTAQLEASAQVGRVATSILNTDQLLRDIANLISDQFQFYYVGVFTLDEDQQQAVLRAATGQAGELLLQQGHHLPVNPNSMVGAAILTRQARVAADVGQGAVRFANPLLPYTRSEIALPLRVGERVLGALDVQSERALAFDEASASVLQAMADQISVALLNAESFNRSEQQSRALSILNQLSRDLSLATSLEAMAEAVNESVTHLTGAASLSLARKTPESAFFALQTFQPGQTPILGDVSLVSAAQSFIGDAFDQDKVKYAPQAETLNSQYPEIDGVFGLGVRSLVALPLRVGDQRLGTFNVAKDQPAAFSAAQLSQLEQVAAQLATALQGLALAEQTRQTLQELDAANRRLVGQAWADFTRSRGALAAEWRHGQWAAFADPVEASQALQVISSASALRFPIRVRGQVVGEFAVPETTSAHWDGDDANFAQALIDQVAQMLETARLLDETERTAQREKAIAAAADKIHRSTEIDAVLRTAVAELNRITGRRGISIQLGFGAVDQKHVPAQTAALAPLVPEKPDGAPAGAEGGL